MQYLIPLVVEPIAEYPSKSRSYLHISVHYVYHTCRDIYVDTLCVLYICIYVCMYVRMYVCMYVRMYVCTYVRMYVRTSVMSCHGMQCNAMLCMYVCMYLMLFYIITLYTYIRACVFHQLS